MPAKTLLASVQALGVVEKADAVGIHTGHIRIDVPAIVQRKNDPVDYFVRSRVDEFADFDVRLGMARFIDDRAIDVDGARIEADRFIIATGTCIVPPAIPGLIECDGDDQADREVHGGPERAIYAYASEDCAWWETELGHPIAPGTFGENLTTQGLDVNNALVGERWLIGSVLLQVTTPRVPCFKLAMRMNDKAFVKKFGAALRPGPYFTIVEPGEFAQGDSIEITHLPAHALSVRELFRIYLFERSRLAELLVPELPDTWRSWVHEQLQG